MANHVSSLKRARQTERKTAVNRANKTRVRGSLRALREALQKGDSKEVAAQYRVTVSALDKSVQKGTLHKNTASRYKSRLSARVKAISTKKAYARVSNVGKAGASPLRPFSFGCPLTRRRRSRRGQIVYLHRAAIQHRQPVAVRR
jgi:small subunit ribosomal protein S20